MENSRALKDEERERKKTHFKLISLQKGRKAIFFLIGKITDPGSYLRLYSVQSQISLENAWRHIVNTIPPWLFRTKHVSVCPFIKKLCICLPKNESDFFKQRLPPSSPLNYAYLIKCLAKTTDKTQSQFSMDTPQMAHFHQSVCHHL